MRGKRKIIPILLLSLFCCSCGMGKNGSDVVELEQVAEKTTVEESTVEKTAVEEPTVEETTVEKQVIEEPEEMPAIVFFLRVEIHRGRSYEDINPPQYLISFFDNQGNLYFVRDSYFNHLKDKEIYDEFVEGKINDYLTLDTTCDSDELRENYELLRSVAENKELKLVPDRYVSPFNHPDIVGDRYWWSAFYYNEDGNLSWIEFRYAPNHPYDVIYRADDERADQIYEWLVSVSDRWK